MAKSKRHLTVHMCMLVMVGSWWHLDAQVPARLNYQGRVMVDGIPFTGDGAFKFALVTSGENPTVLWRSSADGNSDGEPDESVELEVSRGLYSLTLGDVSLAGMDGIVVSDFDGSDIALRVWFSDGQNGFEQLSPDQKIASVAYALRAGSVADSALDQSSLISDLKRRITELEAKVGATTSEVSVPVVSTVADNVDLIDAGYQVFHSIPASTWERTVVQDAPLARVGHSAVWTGEEMIVWGGYLGANTYSLSGGRFEPGADRWSGMTTFGAPSARQSHSAIWTGTEMIVWGGLGPSNFENSGGRYRPSSQGWFSMSSSGAPSARIDHVCIWTGEVMIVWGGRNGSGFSSGGGYYLPVSDAWGGLALANAPAPRHSATAVWTGSDMLLWGGRVSGGVTDTGGVLAVDAEGVPNTWAELRSEAKTPTPRSGHSAVWTGNRMIIWGGSDGDHYYGDGAVYDPEATKEKWTPLSTIGSPSARSEHIALWTGTEMLVLFGENESGALSSGGAYDPAKDKWRALSSSEVSVPRKSARGIWTGDQVIVFGGMDGTQLLAQPQSLDPRPDWYFYQKP